MPQKISNAPLDQLNTFAVSASADTMLVLESIEAVKAQLAFIQQNRQRMVLGGGSNMLFVADYPGLIIYPKFKGIELLSQDAERARISVGASENWHQLVLKATEQGWYGLENLALIPGTVGAAPVQNIGAYGVEVEKFIHRVEYFDLENGTLNYADRKACQFGYRDSVFKRGGQGRYLITRVELDLLRQPQLCLDYKPLAEHFSGLEQVTPMQVVEQVCRIRLQKLPDPDKLPNAGSFFKNPVVSEADYQSIVADYPDLVAFAVADGYKLAAGWLIERAGFKGLREGNIGVHRHQALVLVNYGETNGAKIWRLAQRIQKAIAAQFGVELEPEVRVIGDAKLEQHLQGAD